MKACISLNGKLMLLLNAKTIEENKQIFLTIGQIWEFISLSEVKRSTANFSKVVSGVYLKFSTPSPCRTDWWSRCTSSFPFSSGPLRPSTIQNFCNNFIFVVVVLNVDQNSNKFHLCVNGKTIAPAVLLYEGERDDEHRPQVVLPTSLPSYSHVPPPAQRPRPPKRPACTGEPIPSLPAPSSSSLFCFVYTAVHFPAVPLLKLFQANFKKGSSSYHCYRLLVFLSLPNRYYIPTSAKACVAIWKSLPLHKPHLSLSLIC